MIEFVAGCEFVAIIVLGLIIIGQRKLCAVLVAGLILAERKCRLCRDHYESLAWSVENSDADDVRVGMSALDSRIEAELKEQ